VSQELLEYAQLLELQYERAVVEAWNCGDLAYKLHEAQRVIYDKIKELPTNVRDVVLFCARRFGKSVLIVLMAIEDCIKYPGFRVGIYGPNLSQTIEIVEEKMELIANDAPPGLITKFRYGKLYKIGQSSIRIGGFDKKNVKKNLGKGLDKIYTEEACASKSEEFDYAMKEVLSPLLFHSKGIFVHATTPPPELDHSFLINVIPRAQRSDTFFKFTINDNPLADYDMKAQAIEDSGGLNTVAYRRNYMVEVLRDGSLVCLPRFSKEKSIVDFKIPAHSSWIFFGDLGGVRDKTAGGIAFYDFERAKLCVVDEIEFEPHATSTEIADGIQRLLKWVPEGAQCRMVFDMPGQSQVDFQKMHNLVLQLPSKDDFDAALNSLDVAFSKEKIEIHPRCKFLALSCENGRFNNTRTSFIRTAELGHCDGIAALVYGWRMCDKTTNPFPKKEIMREAQFNPVLRKPPTKPIFKKF
jgi:hypothetical protein